MTIIIPANSAADTGYEVANSCRFNDDDSAEMHKTPGGAGNKDAWTLSMWVKRGRIGTGGTQSLYGVYADSSNQETLAFDSGGNIDKLYWQLYQGGSVVGQLTTNRLFRDVSAWYNIVVSYDSANGTAGNRMRMWINGTEETSFATDTNPSSGLDSAWNGTTKHQIGCIGTGNFFDGYLAEVVSLDGTAVTDATNFGEFDEDSPTIWKPKDVSGLTFGTNGFYLDFEDSANLGNDANGGTDLTEVNLAATDQATDTPTNNFCTWNPLDNYYANSTFSEGNLKLVSGGSGDETYNTSTFGLTAGKWYVELKHEGGNNVLRQLFGITQNPTDDDGQYLGGDNNDSWGYYDNDGKVYHNNSDSVASYDTWTTNDIISLALDLDNNRLYFAKNGTWQGSSDPTDGTNAISIDANYTYFIAWGDASSGNMNSSVNFGSPPYANSSDAADANGYGAFEYAPPSGYYALCTKNLAEFG